MTNLTPNTTQIPNYFLDKLMPILSDTGWRLLCVISRQTLGWIEDTETKRRKEKDWISYSQLILKTGRQKEALSKGLRELEEKKIIEVLDKTGTVLKTQEERRGRALFYRILTSSEIEQVSSNLFGNRTSEIEHTKETYTKEDISLKKDISPHISENAQKIRIHKRYPLEKQQGVHRLAYYLEDLTGANTVDWGKSGMAVKAMLRAGYTEDNIKKVIKFMSTDEWWSKKGFDLSTVRSQIQKIQGAMETKKRSEAWMYEQHPGKTSTA